MSKIKRNNGLLQYKYSVIRNGHRIDNMSFLIQALWLKFKADVLHDRLGWGYVERLATPDDFQPTYLCEFCEKTLAQDSSGAYFHLSS